MDMFYTCCWLPFPGRTYFIKSENTNNSESTTAALHKALDAFQKSLHVCEDLKVKGNVKELEYFEMKARLYLNIGIALSLKKRFFKFQPLFNVNTGKCKYCCLFIYNLLMIFSCIMNTKFLNSEAFL